MASTTDTGTAAQTTPNYNAQATTAAAGMLSAYSSITAGQTQKTIDDTNAKYARTQAQQTLAAGGYEATVKMAEGEIAQAKQRSGAAAGGTLINSGSNADVTQSMQRGNEMDQLMIQTMANRRAYGYSTQATSDEISGNLAKSQGELGAAASALNAFSQIELESDPTFMGQRRGLMLSAGR